MKRSYWAIIAILFLSLDANAIVNENLEFENMDDYSVEFQSESDVGPLQELEEYDLEEMGWSSCKIFTTCSDGRKIGCYAQGNRARCFRKQGKSVKCKAKGTSYSEDC